MRSFWLIVAGFFLGLLLLFSLSLVHQHQQGIFWTGYEERERGLKSYDESRIKSGDIYLFRNNDAPLLQKVVSGQFTHVAMFHRDPKGILFLVEIRQMHNRGISYLPWNHSHFRRHNKNGDSFVRPLRQPLSESASAAFDKFVLDYCIGWDSHLPVYVDLHETENCPFNEIHPRTRSRNMVFSFLACGIRNTLGFKMGNASHGFTCSDLVFYLMKQVLHILPAEKEECCLLPGWFLTAKDLDLVYKRDMLYLP